MKTIPFKLPPVLTIIIVVTLLSSSCSSFRVIPVADYSSSSIHTYDTSGKYIVLRRGGEAWHMFDVQPKGDSITASLDIHLGKNVNHLNPKPKGLNRFKRKKEADVRNTVHLFTNDSSFLYSNTSISIPLSSIYKVDEFRYAVAAYWASIIIPVLLGTLAAVIAGGFIALAIGGGGAVMMSF